jgi:hypothetical protein
MLKEGYDNEPDTEAEINLNINGRLSDLMFKYGQEGNREAFDRLLKRVVGSAFRVGITLMMGKFDLEENIGGTENV